jgi:hypothetical protein
MDEKKKIKLNIEELEERIAPSAPSSIEVDPGVGVEFDVGRSDGIPPPEVTITTQSFEDFTPIVDGGPPPE